LDEECHILSSGDFKSGCFNIEILKTNFLPNELQSNTKSPVSVYIGLDPCMVNSNGKFGFLEGFFSKSYLFSVALSMIFK